MHSSLTLANASWPWLTVAHTPLSLSTCTGDVTHLQKVYHRSVTSSRGSANLIASPWLWEAECGSLTNAVQEIWVVVSIPGLGRSAEGGHGNPLQYSCLENPTDRGDWRTTAHGFTKSRTWWSDLAHTYRCPRPNLQNLWLLPHMAKGTLPVWLSKSFEGRRVTCVTQLSPI